MEEKKLTERESITLIAEMISRTKQRYIGDGNIMLMWGWLTIAVGGLVWFLAVHTLNAAWNWLWFLIPVVGGIATPIMARKSEKERGVKTYSDKISSHLWTAVGIIAFAASVICFGFSIVGIDIWKVMFIFALVIVPFGEIAQGIIVKEKSLMVGGGIGMVIGLFTSGCFVADIKLYACWFMPLFILAFASMMLVPGYVINYNARKQ